MYCITQTATYSDNRDHSLRVGKNPDRVGEVLRGTVEDKLREGQVVMFLKKLI